MISISFSDMDRLRSCIIIASRGLSGSCFIVSFPALTSERIDGIR